VAADLNGSARASRELSNAALDALDGRIDVLVNSAGIFPRSTTPTVDEAIFDEVYAVNVKPPFFLTAAIAPEMTARGSGSIINLGRLLGGPIGNPRRRAVRIHERGHGDPNPGLGRGVRVAGRAHQRDLPPVSCAPRSRTTPPPP
jgi:NAD(P)-dependent dehydrogenase (short-subunit alcohol dehydrogenase family)